MDYGEGRCKSHIVNSMYLFASVPVCLCRSTLCVYYMHMNCNEFIYIIVINKPVAVKTKVGI